MGPSFSQKWDKESYRVAQRSATDYDRDLASLLEERDGERKEKVASPCAAMYIR